MAAASTAEECCGLALESGQPRLAAAARAVEACLAAVHGDTSRAEKTALEVEQLALPMGGSSLLAIAQLARGLAALANGQQLVAFERLRRLFAPDDVAYHPFVSQWAFVDLAEAAALAGVQQEMGPIVAMAEGLAQQNPAPWFEMSARFARPLLARGEPAEELFKEVLDPALIGWPFQRGRLLLLYGMLLRRDRRVAESRAPLRAARDAFDALGAVPWSDRARSELRASGETSRPPSIERWAELTPQELQIAQLAADGFTNREIGERLYLSHRTIGSHLYRLFPKLGISSRAQLASAMESRPGTDN